jgi:hypothetical protein
MKRPLPVDARLTAIALAFRNPDVNLIGDMVLPRTDTDAEFKWLRHDLAQGYTVPDTKVGRKSVPNEVEFTGAEVSDSVDDHGLDDLVPNSDINDDNQGVDPLGKATMYTTSLVQLSREVRVAAKVFNVASYVGGNQQTLAGASQWSDFVNSNPVDAILAALDVPVMRPNIGTFGQQTWTKLRQHPKVVQAFKGTDQGAGAVTRREFADFFELQEIYIGAGFINTAKKGQAVALSRCWGKHAAFTHRDRTAGPQNGMTYGFTAQASPLQTALIDAPSVGVEGSKRVRVYERVKEIVCAPELGYYFQNAIA